jgi:methylmalonyl-CoA/ethylmalonyl-CoA epimerase
MTQVNFFGATAKFHHIGLALSSLDLAMIENLQITADPLQRVKVGFVNLADCCIELIEPVGENSPIQNNIKKGHKFVHLCFEVDEILDGLKHAASHKFKVIQLPAPAVAFDNRSIAWVYHPVWGLYELLERKAFIEDNSI